MTIRESFKSKVEGELNHARGDSGQYAQKSLKDNNNVKQMVTVGSKGSYINISQMSVCVGQQSGKGRRIPFCFRHRTLPHFTKDDFSPEALGFIENSYLRRLMLQEFFFHAMAGREGLDDTAVKTAETGYIHRRLVKALEDVMVHYDGTVHNSLGDLVQFVYGEDGIVGAFIERQKINTFGLDNEAFEHNYRVDAMKLDEEYNELLNDRRLLREFVFPTADGLTPHYLPVNLHRIIQNATEQIRG
ncbi:beta and beta-prime subunits of DNA dependent RNA-polymerase [Rhizopogon vinicolor AM-OR11-026]|uniref:DNA-directed RNA polymerase n=1 Tax=Rhizopogon vinicolor AM-OR11-026 TaxID=1314800 RepID=A0A1B7MFD0_9AGAM|nr:beta and beta-prime subunits of DNA dependent RNA-polymerase [Rhizopogon vinicolor AM-OR11-026]